MASHYSNLKFLNYPDRLEALRRRRLVAPVHIRIKPFNHCNHDCWYCAYRVGNLQLGGDMNTRDALPADKMFEIVDDVIDMGVQAVTFSGGGEPLLYKPLPEVIERLGKGGIRVGSLSNGSNLKGKVADAFAEHGTWVRISMEGWDGKSYAKARNIKEQAFDELIRNMRDFVARKSNCAIGVSFIIGEDNCEHIFEVCELLKDVGVNHVKLSGVIISNDGAETNTYLGKIAPMVTEQIKQASVLEDENFRLLNHFHQIEERFKRNYTFCPNIQYNPVIGADGYVYTCHDKAFTEDGKLGSINDVSFKEFWLSEKTSKRVFSINPTVDCPHHCADHIKNMAMTEFLSIDSDHGKFV